MIKTSKLLPSLAHATSGSAATALSTLLTYPLDLVNTRLKVQRQLRLDGTIPDGARTYDGVWDAFCAIYDREGGVGALFAGLGPDLGKSVADSFLFFLFYTVCLSLSPSLPLFVPLYIYFIFLLFFLLLGRISSWERERIECVMVH